MGDLISRQAVLKAIQKLNIPEDMCVFEIISHIEVAIATLPSVENKGEEYRKGWHDAISKALDEAYDIDVDGERFTVVQEETLLGLGMASEIPSENKGEWIPTSERLPETNKWVLVSVESSSGNHYVEIMRIDKYKGLWTDNIDYYDEIVKAWQPLPEPFMRGNADEL